MTKEKYRSRVSIIVDVLKAIESEDGEDQRLTHIMSKANLPYNRFSNILSELVSKGLIAERETGDKKSYTLTQKGKRYIQEYERFKKLSEAFGLNI
ncbi:MAG: DUF4364 family protein [Thermoprotei archaeon]